MEYSINAPLVFDIEDILNEIEDNIYKDSLSALEINVIELILLEQIAFGTLISKSEKECIVKFDDLKKEMEIENDCTFSNLEITVSRFLFLLNIVTASFTNNKKVAKSSKLDLISQIIEKIEDVLGRKMISTEVSLLEMMFLYCQATENLILKMGNKPAPIKSVDKNNKRSVEQILKEDLNTNIYDNSNPKH